MSSIAPPIIPCQKDEGRKGSYQKRKNAGMLSHFNWSNAEKFSLCQVIDGKV
jgi:hypothetical protein